MKRKIFSILFTLVLVYISRQKGENSGRFELGRYGDGYGVEPKTISRQYLALGSVGIAG